VTILGRLLRFLGMPSPGNPILARFRGIDRRLDDHERRITATEAEQREAARDVAMLSDIVMRSRRRAGLAIRRRPRRTR
jgi:hypothetical protein